MFKVGRLCPFIFAAIMLIAGCGSEDSEAADNSTEDSDTSVNDEVEPSTDDAASSDTDADEVSEDTAEASDGAIPATATGCEALLDAFADQPDTNARCDDDWLLFDSDGLGEIDPEQQELRMMVGITSWILRVPIPFDYEWRIPTDSTWLDQIAQASPRGPIAVAIDGVPIFHYEARPEGSTLLQDYNPRSDTVVAGELDHCGGHAGQGDDYHYHYAPVCLVDEHDLSQPIAFGLDGAPIYYGTAGTDYYGVGQFNDIDLLPDTPLDDCNAVQLEDGSWVHYTTVDPPYVIGCHHGLVDSDLQIEPSPMRPQREAGAYGGEVGEASQTLVTDWYVDSEGWMRLEHTSFDGQGTSGVLYRQADGDDCWEFDFRADIDTPGVVETYCR